MLYASFPVFFEIGLGSPTRVWVAFAGLFLLHLLIGLVHAIVDRNRDSSFLQRWWDHAAFNSQKSEVPNDTLHSVIDVPQLWFSVAMVVIFLSVALGNRYASFATPSQLLKSDASKALVVVYVEKWFFRDIKHVRHSRREAQDELLILSGENVEQIVLLTGNKVTSP
jgi:hypothetical protein